MRSVMKPEAQKGKMNHIQVRDIYRFQGFQSSKGNCREIGDGCGIYEQFGRFTFVGFWRENKFDGMGFCRWTSGDAYLGTYFQGKKHGFGLFRYRNGNLFQGDWKFDSKTGEGVYRNRERGYTYFGNWYDNLRQGLGRTGMNKKSSKTEIGTRELFFETKNMVKELCSSVKME